MSKRTNKISEKEKSVSTQTLPKSIGETKRSADAIRRMAKSRLESPPPKFEKDGANYKFKENGLSLPTPLVETFGSGDLDFVQYQVNHLINIAPQESTATGANALFAFMHGLDPKDEVESALASQMAAVHELAMSCMRGAAKSGDDSFIDMKLNQANKLLRTFTLQIDALNRYRGKGQQKVTVEHVTVNSGGQAIVGAIGHQGPRKGGGA